MLIVGLVSTREEQYEVRFVAEMFLIGERFRFLARQNKGDIKRKQG